MPLFFFLFSVGIIAKCPRVNFALQKGLTQGLSCETFLQSAVTDVQ